jgi:hypothetical protein
MHSYVDKNLILVKSGCYIGALLCDGKSNQRSNTPAAEIKNPKPAALQHAMNHGGDDANRRLVSTRAGTHETNQHRHMDKRIDLQVTRCLT